MMPSGHHDAAIVLHVHQMKIVDEVGGPCRIKWRNFVYFRDGRVPCKEACVDVILMVCAASRKNGLSTYVKWLTDSILGICLHAISAAPVFRIVLVFLKNIMFPSF